MLHKVNSGQLYNSNTQHNRLLVNYSKGESESRKKPYRFRLKQNIWIKVEIKHIWKKF